MRRSEETTKRDKSAAPALGPGPVVLDFRNSLNNLSSRATVIFLYNNNYMNIIMSSETMIFGEHVWAKLEGWRWWPAVVMDPQRHAALDKAATAAAGGKVCRYDLNACAGTLVMLQLAFAFRIACLLVSVSRLCNGKEEWTQNDASALL